MPNTSVISILIVILAVILVDVFCADIANSQRTEQNFEQNPADASKSTTPRPTTGQRRTTNPNNRPTTQNPRKWIQQNNIWIRNEQASSQNGQVARQDNTNRQNAGGTSKAGNGPSSTSAKPPLNRGDTYTVLKPQIPQHNRQEALINGLGGNQPKTPLPTTNKPMSYAGAVGPKNPSPATPPPSNPKKDTSSSTGPPGDNIEDLDDNQNGNSGNADSSVTDDELREFSEALLRKDTNNAMKYVTLNLQGMTSSRSSNDEAPLPLLKIEEGAYKIPSIEKLVLLYNNYFLEASQNEVYTGQERIEENNLLDTVLATPSMQFARSFLVQKGKIGKDPKEFRDLLRQIWFYMYSRGRGRIGSSGFEHIFLAEIKNSQVSGLHNWLYFNEEETQKRANYLGYMKKLDLGEKGAILKYHFTFHDIDKPVGSMFIGTSPELEMALYSTCFVLRADRICPLKMNGNRFVIRTYSYRYRGKNMIGSAFPEI